MNPSGPRGGGGSSATGLPPLPSRGRSTARSRALARRPSKARPQPLAPPRPTGNVALIDLLDRLLQGGIVIQGDITLTAADIDLVKLDLRILVAAIDKAMGS